MNDMSYIVCSIKTTEKGLTIPRFFGFFGHMLYYQIQSAIYKRMRSYLLTEVVMTV